MYTIVFIAITLLVLAGLALFGFFILKMDKHFDKKDRLGNIENSKKKDPSKPA